MQVEAMERWQRRSPAFTRGKFKPHVFLSLCHCSDLTQQLLILCRYIIMEILLVSPAVHSSRIHGGCTFPVKFILSELVLVLLDCQCFCALYGGCSYYTVIQLLKYIPASCSLVFITSVFSFYLLNIPPHDSSCCLDTYMGLFTVVYECLAFPLSLFSLTTAYQAENYYLPSSREDMVGLSALPKVCVA